VSMGSMGGSLLTATAGADNDLAVISVR